MKEKRFPQPNAVINKIVLFFFLAVTAFSVCAQTKSDEDAGQKRLKRARALVAAHKLDAAITELENLRATTTDDAVRDVSSIMLMSIYLEEGEYVRAQNLLEQTYKARAPQNENSTRTYFALAGQAVNGAREHLSRFRSFGINITDKELPAEAASDLDHMRTLLERIAEQAREICAQDQKCFDALGLLEEAATVRETLARTKQEHQQWQREITDARQKLAESETRIASLSALPVRNVSAPVQAATAPITSNSSPAISPTPNHSTNTSTKKTTTAAEKRTDAKPAQQPVVIEKPQANSIAQNAGARDVGSLLELATQKVNPSYPQMARMAHVTGLVTVRLEVDENGAVKTVNSINGPQLLRQAAEDAARRWKFRPMIVDGQPVRVQGYINFNFML